MFLSENSSEINTEDVYVYHESSFLSDIKKAFNQYSKKGEKTAKDIRKKVDPLHVNSYTDIVQEIQKQIRDADSPKALLGVYRRVVNELSVAKEILEKLKNKIKVGISVKELNKLSNAVTSFINHLEKIKISVSKKLEK